MQKSDPSKIPVINLEPLTTPLKTEQTLLNTIICFDEKKYLVLSPTEKWQLVCQLLKQFGVQVQGVTLELPWLEKDSIFMGYLLNLFSKLIGSSVYCQYFAGKQCWKFGLAQE